MKLFYPIDLGWLPGTEFTLSFNIAREKAGIYSEIQGGIKVTHGWEDAEVLRHTMASVTKFHVEFTYEDDDFNLVIFNAPAANTPRMAIQRLYNDYVENSGKYFEPAFSSACNDVAQELMSEWFDDVINNAKRYNKDEVYDND
jgi:calcineurin-like phosphoesterase family protein